MYRSNARTPSAASKIVWFDATRAFVCAIVVFYALYAALVVVGGAGVRLVQVAAPLFAIAAATGAYFLVRAWKCVRLTLDPAHRHLCVTTRTGTRLETEILRLEEPVHAAVFVTTSWSQRTPHHYSLLLRDSVGADVALLTSGHDARLVDVARDLNAALRAYGAEL